jgi:chorismate synthase
MSGNTIGTLFTVTSFGESHGPAIGCIVDGCPPGLAISETDIQAELDRRKPGTSRHVTQRREPDTVEILSGVFEGKTTGAPIGLLIRNTDQRSKDYGNIAEQFRPGHADYTYWQKYGTRDYRGGGRSSARETAVRVAAGAIARKWLFDRYDITICGWMDQLGPISIPFVSVEEICQNPFFAPNNGIVTELEAYMDALRKDGDSVGGGITVTARGVPAGWGEPVYDRFDADLAEQGDEITPQGFMSNNAGGVLGGITTGQDIVARIAIKPTSSIRTPRRSINVRNEDVMVETFGRHDPCVAIRATPIAEAMMAIVLMDHALRHRAQCADVDSGLPQVPARAPGHRAGF